MKIRIKFEKTGAMKFVGHLDIMRYFQRALRRADIDIAYTEGFSPHPIMSFALPLGVGTESKGEYFDIRVHTTKSSKEAIEAINAQMAEGVVITSYKKLPDDAKKSMAMVEAADYELTYRDEYEPDFDWQTRLLEFYNQSAITIVKQTKKSERELDLKPLIFELKVDDKKIYMKLKAGSVDNIKPQLVMDAFHQFCGIERPAFALNCMRLDLFAISNKDDNKNKNLEFIALDAFGEDIYE